MSREKAETEETDKVNKMDLVRKSMKELGDDAKPLALQKHIKDKHGVDLSTSMISSYKGYILKRELGKSGIRRRAKVQAAAAQAFYATQTTQTTHAGKGITIEDVEMIRELTHRLGAEKVRKLTEVLSK